jgi:hypothetical protein
MKIPFALSIAAAALLAGCAMDEPRQVARADCKVAPVTTRSAVNKPGNVTELDRRWAEAQLRSSDYRRAQLERNGGVGNNIEDALRDCP